ncbi:ABC transporter substrate-binding protein [Gelria sp. Kuro-4]|uniref:ABC transporter substrate-binding protein n=1 Tax=Gelria sp. Kuro-4 TaxID=2796927 RepID=UPI001BEFE66B|nr:ABC transporter substrate-binding protein [Gelria sp. Kuro-4]BCV25682.1 ABC transporter substrate-binding protein [Gelria sp. Kuro-4]
MLRRRVCFVLALVVLLALVAGCKPAGPTAPAPTPGSTPSPPPPAKDGIVIALQGEPTSLDPQFPDDGNCRAVTDNVFNRLLELDGKTLAPVPGLAVEWKAVDSTTWELKLRPNVKFHSGDAFSAEDAAFSIKRIIDPAYKSQIAGNFATIKDAQAVDPLTLRIITSGPDPILPKRLTRLDIVSKNYVTANPDKAAVAPVGTGPYKFVAWNRGSDITLERFDGFWGPQPAITEVKYRFIQEGSTRLAALKAGEIDLAVNLLPEYVNQAPKVVTSPGIEISFLRFNTLRGPMTNPLLRQAANLAIDREALARDLFLGYALPAYQMGKEGYFGFNKRLPPIPHDLEKAKALLKQAGYKGEPIELVSERGRWLKDGELTEAVAAMLSEVGFNIKIKFLSWQEWLDTLFNVEKAPAIIFSCNGNELFDFDRFFSACIQTGAPQSAMSVPAIDQKIVAARTEMDPAKRQALYEELIQAVYDYNFGAPLLNLKDIYGLAKHLEWTPREDSRITVYEMRLAGAQAQ